MVKKKKTDDVVTSPGHPRCDLEPRGLLLAPRCVDIDGQGVAGHNCCVSARLLVAFLAAGVAAPVARGSRFVIRVLLAALLLTIGPR